MPEKNRTASGVLGGLAGLVGLSAVAGVLVTATVTPAIALSGAAASQAITMFDNLPSVLDIDKLMLPVTFYAKDHSTGADVELAKFYDQNRSPVGFDEVATVMYDAILSSEDPRYYQHGGVDIIGTTRAVLQNLEGGGQTQGGSSISQQYVKNVLIQKCEQGAETTFETDAEGAIVYDEAGNPVIEEAYADALQRCWEEATNAVGNEGIQRKLQEMRYAISLEQKYSKSDILLGYLNIANFGGQTYGIDAAAKRYFGVSAKDLSLSQSATLAGIVQNPNLYRIDMPGGTQTADDGTPINAQPDGQVLAPEGMLAALDSKLAAGEITQEQYTAAADGYTSTKGRQLYVLSRLLDDGKITQEQYDAAVIEPISPNIQPITQGCQAAGGAAYFCQYVKNLILNDPAFGAEEEDRERLLKRGGLNIYTTLDLRLQSAAEQAMTEWAPTSLEGWVDSTTGKFGSSAVNIEATTGRVLAIAQNTRFSEDAALAADPNYSSLVYAANYQYGRSTGFEAGSTFKLFTLIDWLEKGHSLNERLNGTLRIIPRLTDSCRGDWVNTERTRVNNFAGNGYTGTPMQFTRDSLNTGFFAMAEKLDLCDIEKVAAKMGVTLGDGNPVVTNNLVSIIGSSAVTPIGMAGAYGTVANNGIYCQPKAIDRVTDADGVDMPQYVPQTTCTQVLDPSIAATAAFALQGVMNSGGTGQGANPYDGTPLLGKTGTHESKQTWMIESSSAVTTAVWVGNSDGAGDVYNSWSNGTKIGTSSRYEIAYRMQAAADMFYPGAEFPAPDSNLTRQVLADLPSVVGMPVAQAQQTLADAGFQSILGAPIDAKDAEGIVAAQDPGAGQVAGGTTVTIFPSNGQGVSVPDVSGRQLDRAVSDLRGAGFGNVQPGQCTVDASADPRGKVTGTNPAAGTVTNRNTAISVAYSARDCDT